MLKTLGDAEWTGYLQQYAPFAVSAPVAQPVFELTTILRYDQLPAAVEGFMKETQQSDDGSDIIAGQLSGHPCFEFLLHGRLAARLTTTNDYRLGSVELGPEPGFGLNNALMVMFALATSCSQTALFHSSVIGYKGRGYMFLGKSGTGKSTHSGLWLRHIEGTELLNDDNPVVRIVNGEALVYGSPWSGKTHCYLQEKAPVAALVRLRQAPENKMCRLSTLEAFAALQPSLPPAFFTVDQCRDRALRFVADVVGRVPVYRLDCLPDAEAALLACQTLFANQHRI